MASGGRRRRAHRFRPSKLRLETRLRSLDPHSSGPRLSELLVAPLARHARFCRSRLLQLDAPHAGGFRGTLERTPRRPAFVRWLPRDLPCNGLGERQRARARLGGRRCFRYETVLSSCAPHGARSRTHADARPEDGAAMAAPRSRGGGGVVSGLEPRLRLAFSGEEIPRSRTDRASGSRSSEGIAPDDARLHGRRRGFRRALARVQVFLRRVFLHGLQQERRDPLEIRRRKLPSSHARHPDAPR